MLVRDQVMQATFVPTVDARLDQDR